MYVWFPSKTLSSTEPNQHSTTLLQKSCVHILGRRNKFMKNVSLCYQEQAWQYINTGKSMRPKVIFNCYKLLQPRHFLIGFQWEVRLCAHIFLKGCTILAKTKATFMTEQFIRKKMGGAYQFSFSPQSLSLLHLSPEMQKPKPCM